jgi:hypothetical protein
MRYLAAIVVLAACSGVAAGTPDEPARRDGVWLLNGIRQYQRLNAHESLSDKDADDARVVTSYVCGVVNFEKYLVQRANMLVGALQEGRKRKPLIDPRMRAGMTQALPLLAPLMKTGFVTDDPTCERVFVMVGDFLDQYPEVLERDAGALVENALLAAYTQSDDQ